MNTLAETVAEYTAIARANGLASLTIEGITVVLASPAPSAPKPGSEKALEEAIEQFVSEKCRCGHFKYDHRADVGCVHGCDVARCVTLGAAPGQPMDPVVVASRSR